MEKKTVGILGGMGPLATVDLFKKIILHTNAAKDQDHIRVLIDNNTNIPDRTAALLYGGTDPLPEMIKSAKLLEREGADCLVMPCNTAHQYFEPLQNSVGIKFLNMIDLTCGAIQEKGIICAGLLATTGTIGSGIYQRYCQAKGIELFVPNSVQQETIMDMIYNGVKAGKLSYDTRKMEDIIEEMRQKGAQSIILGCTELPLAVELYRLDIEAVDPTLELAKGAIRFAGGSGLLKA